MKKLVQPNLRIDFAPSERQMELWEALQPNRCDKCGGSLEMRLSGYDIKGNPVYQATCVKCGNSDIPEQILAGGSAGGGKAETLDSDVLTPFGFKKLREIKLGAFITNPMTGGQQKVIQLHPIEKHPYYRITFVDKTYVDCSEGHLWRCHVSRKKSKRAKKYDIPIDTIWETKAMYDWYERKKGGMYNGVNLITPLTEPVKFTLGMHKPRIDPYILGAIIGDGCITDTCINSNYVYFTSEDSEIIDRFVANGYDMSKWYLCTDNHSRAYHIKDEQLINELKRIGIAGNNSKNHYIPKEYKMASIEDRIKLMQGLIDTDGYVDDRGHIIYTTISEQLANDVAFVVRSLGGVATITKGKAGYKNSKGIYIRCNDAYDVQIRTKMNPDLCGLTRKKKRAKYEFNGGASELGKRIVSIEYIGIREGRCITVDDVNGLFITNDFTVTHNSYLGSVWLITSCMRFEAIRMVVARKTLKVLRESTWVTLLRVLRDWKLEEGVHYHINNMMGTLTFWNGSQIIMMELAPSLQDPDYNRLGSLEITGAFVDEVSEVTEKAIEVLASRIRYKIEDTFIVGKILMTTNPALTWIRPTFVMDDDGNPVKLQKGYRYIPFTLFDNPNQQFRNIYYNKLSKIRDKATRDRLLYGNWVFTESNKVAAYWEFDGNKHIKSNLFETSYDPMKPIILSFDFNVRPYMSCIAIQIDYEQKIFYVLTEFIGRPKDKLNNTPAFSRYIRGKLIEWGHMTDAITTGDPAGMARSTQTEDGVNNFSIVTKNLQTPIVKPKLKLLNKQPAQSTRLDFINEVFRGYSGWKIYIDLRCRRLTEDLVYQKKNPDGTKEKKKVLDEMGGKSEKYGHCSDCLDYAMIYFLNEEYSKFRTNETDIITTVSSDDVVYNGFDY